MRMRTQEGQAANLSEVPAQVRAKAQPNRQSLDTASSQQGSRGHSLAHVPVRSPSLRSPSDPRAEAEAAQLGHRIGSQLAGRHRQQLSNGALPRGIRDLAERNLGVDLDDTRIDAGAHGQAKAKHHQADAVTEGSTISMAPGRLTTATPAGRTLLGHELTHVAQQRSTGVVGVQCDKTKQMTRDEFTGHLAGKSLDVATLTADPRLRGVDLTAADLDANGTISTEPEFNALFTGIDGLDRDGDHDTVASRDADGSGNNVTVALAAISDAAGVADLATPLDEAIKSRGFTDRIAHVGTRKANVSEVAQLRRTAKVTQIRDPKDAEQLRVGRTTYDFSKDADIEAFVSTLRVAPDTTTKLIDAIKGAVVSWSSGRSEVAQIARALAPAERGESIPSRLVISGHSSGSNTVWGDQGKVRQSDFKALAEALPHAAKLIEDIHVAACYCGGEPDVLAWQSIFPNVKTVWAYTGSGPPAEGDAPQHLARWSLVTKGRTADFDRSKVSTEDSAVWTVDGGYKSGDAPKPLADVRQAVTAGEATFKEFFDGTQTVTSTGSGPLRTFYNDLQALVQHADLPKGELPAQKQRLNQTILLIYYAKSVAKNFDKAHGPAITAGFGALKLAVPEFGKLSRADGLARIAAFVKALDASDPKPTPAATLLPLLMGLQTIDPNVLPHAWIE